MPRDTAPRFTLRTLGGIELSANGNAPDAAVVTQHKRLALLTYLTLARPRGLHHRDSLLALFWPEQSQDAARHSLRQAIYFLRSRMDQDALETRGRERIGVDHHRVWCDAIAFEQAAGREDLARAGELYRGPFLHGFFVTDASREFETWIENERARLHDLWRDVGIQLADRADLEGDLETAVAWLKRLAVAAPGDEPVIHRLIDVLDRMGDRAAAVEAYRGFETFVREEYRVAPSADIAATFRRIERQSATPGDDTGLAGPAPLPVVATPLIGRDDEVAEILELLAAARMLTLVGPGGCGKTRLALEVARRVSGRDPQCVWFVALAQIADPIGIARAIAHAAGVPPSAERPLEAIRNAAAEREILVVLDNFEHLTDGAEVVNDLLQLSPDLRVLVTSRAPLRLNAERAYPVPPLSLPSTADTISARRVLAAGSVALFAERARAVEPSFRVDDDNAALVADICRRLDGLPLAIELAAARLRAFSVTAIARLLDRPFDLLADGAVDLPDRQRSMENTLRWSDDLLTENERRLFYALALFPGGFALDAAESIWGPPEDGRDKAIDVVSALVRHSLVQPRKTAGSLPRFRMLEPIREFALAGLERSGERAEWRRRQDAFYVAVVEEAECHFCTDDQSDSLEGLERELPNLEYVLGRAIATKRGETAYRMAAALWRFFLLRGYLTEGRRYLEQCLALGDVARPALRAEVHLGAAILAKQQRDMTTAIEHFEAARSLARHAGEAHTAGLALLNLGFARREIGDLAGAREVMEMVWVEGERLEKPAWVAAALETLATIARQQQDVETSRRLLEKGLELARESGDRRRIAHALLSLADVARGEGDLESAAGLTERSLDHYRALRDAMGTADALSQLAGLARLQGALDLARERYGQALMLHHNAGFVLGVASTLVGIARLQLDEGRLNRAARMAGKVQALVDSGEASFEPTLQEEFETLKTDLQRSMSTTEWANRSTEGRAMTIDDAIFLGLRLARRRRARSERV